MSSPFDQVNEVNRQRALGGGVDQSRLALSQAGREYLAAQLQQQQAQAQQAAAEQATRYRVAKSLAVAMEESKTRGATAVKDDFYGTEAEKLAKKALDAAARGDRASAEKLYSQALKAHADYVTKDIGSRTAQLGERVSEGKDVSNLLSDIVERSRVAYDLRVGVQEGETFGSFVPRLASASYDKYVRELEGAARRADNAGDTSRLDWRLDYQKKYGVDPINVKVPDRYGNKEVSLTSLGAVGLDVDKASKYAQDYAKAKEDATKAISDSISKQQLENAKKIFGNATDAGTPLSQVGQRTAFNVRLEGGRFVADVSGTKYNVKDVPYANLSSEQKQKYLQKQLAPTIEYIFKNAGRPVFDYGPNVKPTGQGTVIYTNPLTGQSKEYNERMFVPQGMTSSTPATAGTRQYIDEKTGKIKTEYLTNEAVRDIEMNLPSGQSVISASFKNEKGEVNSIPTSFFTRPQSQVPFKPDEVAGYAINYNVDKKGRVKIGDVTYTPKAKPIVSDITNVADVKVDTSVPSAGDNADQIRSGQIAGALKVIDKDYRDEVSQYLQSESDKLKGSGKIFDASTLVQVARSYVSYEKAQAGVVDSDKIYFNPDPTVPQKFLSLPNKVGSSIVDTDAMGTKLRYTLEEDNKIKIEPAEKPQEFSPNPAEELWRGLVEYPSSWVAGGIDLATQTPMFAGLKPVSQFIKDNTSLKTLSIIYGGISELAGKDTDIGRSYKVYSEHAGEQAKVETGAPVGMLDNAIGLAGKGVGIETGLTEEWAEQSRKRPIESIFASAIDIPLIISGVGGAIDIASGVGSKLGLLGRGATRVRASEFSEDLANLSGHKPLERPLAITIDGQPVKAPQPVWSWEVRQNFADSAAPKGRGLVADVDPTRERFLNPVQKDFFDTYMSNGGVLGAAGRVVEQATRPTEFAQPRLRWDEKKGEYVFEKSVVSDYYPAEPFGRDLLSGVQSEVNAVKSASSARGPSKPFWSADDLFRNDNAGGTLPPSEGGGGRPPGGLSGSSFSTTSSGGGTILEQVVKEETPVAQAAGQPVNKPYTTTAGSAKPVAGGWQAPTIPLGFGNSLTLLRMRKSRGEETISAAKTPPGYQGPTLADIVEKGVSNIPSVSKVADVGGVQTLQSNSDLTNWWIRNKSLGLVRTVKTVSTQPTLQENSLLDTELALSTDLGTEQGTQQVQEQQTETILAQIQIPGLDVPLTSPLDIPINPPPTERTPGGGFDYWSYFSLAEQKKPAGKKKLKRGERSYKIAPLAGLTFGARASWLDFVDEWGF